MTRWRLVARIVLVVAALVVLAIAATADDSRGSIDLAPGPVLVTITPTPPLVWVAYRTGAAT